MYPELLNKVYRRVSLKMSAVMITVGQQRVKKGKKSYLVKIFGEKYINIANYNFVRV